MLSGWGIGALVDHFSTKTASGAVDFSAGWSYAFGVLIVAALIGSLILALVWKAKADGYDD